MKSEHVNIIASGSDANCVLYFDEIMIDAGVRFSRIESLNLKDLKIILLTHVHSDHFNRYTIKMLQYAKPSLRIGCAPWMLEHLKGVRNVDVYELNRWYDYGLFKVSAFQLYHDVQNCGYRIEKSGVKIFHATDTAHLEGITAKDYDVYCIEHNYDDEVIRQNIEIARENNQYHHGIGAMNSHLSNQQAQDFYLKNKKESSVLIRLHESKTNQ